MSVQWFIADVLTGVSKALKPLVNALESPVTFGAFLASYGYSSLITDTQQIEAKFSIVKGAYDALEIAVKEVDSLRGQENTSVEITLKAVQKLGTAATNLFHAIDGLKGMTDYASLPAPLNQESFWKDFPPELAESLLYRYLETHKPKLFGLLTAFGIVSAEDADPASLPSFRTPYRRRQVNWDRIGLIVSHPDQFLSKVYGLGNTFEHSKFTGNLAILANTFGVPAAQTDLSEELLSAYYGGNPQNTVRQLLAPLYWDAIETGGGYGYTSLDLIVAPIPPAGNPGNTPSGFVFFPVLRGHAGKGIEIVPNVVATLEGAFKSTGSVRLEVRAEEVQAVIPPALGVEIGSRAELVVAPEKALILLGVEGSSRFEIARLAIELSVRGPVGDLEYETSFNVENAALVINLVEGDGFLQKVLPKDGFRTEFDLAIGWSNRKGLYFRGSAGFEVTLPVHKSILDVLTVESIYLALRTQAIESGAQDPAIETVAAATAKVELGPFKASVARMGVRAELIFPKDKKGGNLGPANLALGFKPPDGAGMVIDAEAIVGGGYLEFDRENEQYAGILQLEVKGGIALKAIGLLTTRMPDGSKGFSLLVIITAEFPPIQLGYGFTLSGVGGLLGVHRTMVIDVLRAGIKNRTLDSILFPKNPVDNATKIISDLRGVFPVASGRFVFGPMAILGWGAPTILTLELGILIELPAPVRVALLGTLTMILPEEKAPAVVVHMDVLGVLDFDKGDVSIDATLYDSRIAVFALTGDMALRASWGASPTFALSAGGFNPRFQPPPAFPSLDRLALTLATGDNPRLRLEAYLALTSNTAQLGARVDLYAEQAAELLGVKKTFSVEAYLGFDTLIHFSPFGLIADIGAQATVKLDGEPLFQVAVNMTLTGPEPWHAWGEATFEFLGKRRIPFDVTVGQPAAAELPPPPDPLERLRVALADRRNWSAQLPSSGHMLVTLRQIEAGKVEILVHPLGDLTVRQREVPLEVEIARFGSLPLPARKKYKIEKIELGTHQPALKENQQVRDAFAPGQFFEMSDDEKLSRPAFQPLPSGYTRLGVTGTEYPSSAARTATFHYDTVVIDKKDEVAPRHEAAYALAPQLMSVLAERGAAAESPMRQTGSARFAGPSQKVVVKEPAYAVANTEDLAVEATAMSYIEAETARAEMGGDGAGWQVVGAHEVEG